MPPAPASSQSTEFSWPGGAKAAVSLTYDDAIASQRTNARDQLDEAGLTGTFFLKGASEDLRDYRAEWTKLLAGGHELASHTMHHPCDRKFDWVPKGYAIQDYDLERMKGDLSETVALLGALQAPAPYTFAYPCGETGVGEARHSYIPLVREQFLAARGVNHGVQDPRSIDFAKVASVDGAQPAETLLAHVQEAVDQGGWLVFTFHGVGGDYIEVSSEAHQALLAELHRRKPEIWTATFRSVAQYVREQRQP